jgi:NADPH:quinone reductase-like Zn-dependent oxidoreductase
MSTNTLNVQTTTSTSSGRAVATQQRLVITGEDKPYTLQTITEAIPEPAPGYARVQVQAAGVAFADVMVRQGMYPGAPKNPMTPGYDIVGIVDALGDGVDSLHLGQPVAALLPKFGGHAQFVCVPTELLVPVPAGLDPVKAVSTILNYLTAHRMLHTTTKAQKGERLLVHSAAGGVGTALLQLGQIAGLEMVGTASKSKHDIVAAYGATPIDYKHEDFATRIRELTGDGIDVVCDPVGGETMMKSYDLLRPGGRLVNYGFLDAMDKGGTAVFTSLARLYLTKLKPDGKQISMFGSTPTIAAKENDWYRETLAQLFNMLKEGQIDPVISEILPLSDAAKALDLLENGRVQGKIVLTN